MMDTLLIGDYILVNKFLFGAEIPLTDRHLPGLRDPRHGDIVVFKYPNDETRDFIKRIIAVGGDTIQVRDNRVLLNGHSIDEHAAGSPPAPTAQCSYAYASCSRCPRAPTSDGHNRDNPRTAATGASSAREDPGKASDLLVGTGRAWLRWQRLGK
jgi:hypothetical protein